jgi:hypothetical protein
MWSMGSRAVVLALALSVLGAVGLASASSCVVVRMQCARCVQSAHRLLTRRAMRQAADCFANTH